MKGLVETELLKVLLTRSTWAVLAVAAALGAARVELVVRSVGTAGAETAGSAALARSVLGASGTGMVLVLLLGSLAVTSEYRHRTMTRTLLATPSRLKLLTAKAFAVAMLGAALAVVLFALAAARGLAAGVLEARLDGPVVRLVLGGTLGAALWGCLGVAVGALLRNETLGVLLPLAWFLVVESLLPAYGLARVMPWTPGGATAALAAADATSSPPAWAAGLVLAGYVAAIGLPAARRLVRADIT